MRQQYVCSAGQNDENIRCMEKLLNIRIFAHGNELHLEGGGDKTRNLFLRLIDMIRQSIRQGQMPGPDLVRSAHEALMSANSNDVERLTATGLDIPGCETTIHPRNLSQVRYIEMMQRFDLLFSIGPAGTGKTFLAVAYALQAVLKRQNRKLIVTRPVVEAGEHLGYLPGDLAQKLHPYLHPIFDAVEYMIGLAGMKRMEEQGQFEVAPLAYMRGRSLDHCLIILDEAQNTTPSQMKMFLTRLGLSSQMIITGDVTQIDLPDPRKSGLLHARRVLESVPGIGFHRFEKRDIIRNPLVQRIVEAYEQKRD